MSDLNARIDAVIEGYAKRYALCESSQALLAKLVEDNPNYQGVFTPSILSKAKYHLDCLERLSARVSPTTGHCVCWPTDDGDVYGVISNTSDTKASLCSNADIHVASGSRQSFSISGNLFFDTNIDRLVHSGTVTRGYKMFASDSKESLTLILNVEMKLWKVTP